MTTTLSFLEQSHSVVWASFMAVEPPRLTPWTSGRINKFLSLQLRTLISLVCTFIHPWCNYKLEECFSIIYQDPENIPL